MLSFAKVNVNCIQFHFTSISRVHKLRVEYGVFLNQGARMQAMRRTTIAIVSVVAALTLSACGGSTDSATTGETSSVIKGGAQDAADDPATSEVEAEVVEAEVVEAEAEADSQEMPSNDVCPDLRRADIFTCL
jgi:hypothetical protein